MEVDVSESPRATDDNQITIQEGSHDQPSVETIALATSAARAGALASLEEREMTRLVSSAVNTTLQKLELKLQQFSELENTLQAERRELERGRQQLFLDRLAFRKRLAEAEETMRAASMKGGEEGARMVRDIGYGGERFAFQAPQDLSMDNVQPLSVTGGNYRNFEL